MTSKVEEVARAIYEGRNGHGCKAWSRLPKAHRDPYILDALNAVHEMRTPTEHMVKSGHRGFCFGRPLETYQEMIDAALSEEGR